MSEHIQDEQRLEKLIRQGDIYYDRLHDFSITIPRCYEDVYVNNFFPPTARLWNSLPMECFPLNYDLNDFKLGLRDTFYH